jgi:hypothetical protein
VSPTDGIAALTVLNHIVVKAGYARPADHRHLYSHGLARYRPKEGYLGRVGVDWTEFGRWLGDVVLLGPSFPLVPRQDVEIALLNDIPGTVFSRQRVGGDINAHKLVEIVLRPQRSLAGSKDLGAATVQGIGGTGSRSRSGTDLNLLNAVGTGELAGRPGS